MIGKAFNLGTGNEHKIGDVAEKIIFIINPKAKIIHEQSRFRPEKSEVMRLRADIKKITRFTNWKCEYTFTEGLERTIKWYVQNKKVLLDSYTPNFV